MDTKVLFSSVSCEWPTPQWLFDQLDQEFHFTLDVCATPENAKTARFFSEIEGTLSRPWYGTAWMNPPYGRKIGDWVHKALCESRHGATVVCLLPARTDTLWFHNFCLQGEIRFIKGRLKFGDAIHNAPFPSMIVIFRPPKDN